MVTKKKVQQPKRLQASRGAQISKKSRADPVDKNLLKKQVPLELEGASRRQSGRQQNKNRVVQNVTPKSRLLVTPAVPKAKPKEKTASATPKDAYEFSETDDFISSTLSSSSHSSAKSKKCTSSGTKPSDKKGKTGTSAKVSKKQSAAGSGKKSLVKRPQSQDKKQTSTPVGTETGKAASKSALHSHAHGPGKRRSPRHPPALLDISVTPILPVPASSSPPKRRRPNDYDPQNDSYVAPVLPESSSNSQAVPLSTPGGASKPKQRQRASGSRSKGKTTRQPAQSPVCTPTSAASSSSSSSSAKPNLKRKQPQPANRSNTCASTESEKNSAGVNGNKRKIQKKGESIKKVQDSPKSSQGKASKTRNVNPKAVQSKSVKEDSVPVTFSKQTPKDKPLTAHTKARKKDVWEPGNEEMYCLSMSNDSGISLSSDLSSAATSPETGSFPGFMEEEPLIRAPEDMSFSPPPSTNTSAAVKDPESSLNKSSSKSYKAGTIKREKGRHSTSRIEAWASQVNQHMEDAESFELFIEG